MRVLYVQYTNPGAYPPLVRGAQLLAEAGAEVLMLGTHVPGLDALSADDAVGLEVRLLPSSSEGWRGWRLKANYARYAAWVARQGSAWKPDWVYASDVLAAPVALALGSMTKARTVYHEHDAPSLEHDSWTMRQCLAARSHLVRQAAIVIAPNAERAVRLSREVGGGRPVHTVWNCPRRPVAAPVRDAAGRPPGTLTVLFRGSINAQRLPRTVIDAVAQAGDGVALDIVGYETSGSRGYVDELLRLASATGIGQRVRALGTVPEAELARVCARADVGLALMPSESSDVNMQHMAGASNKLFEYLSYGIAPLVTDLPDWRTAFVEPGYALSCRPENAESLARRLVWAASHPTELRAMTARGFERLRQDWNYETQFAPVMREMGSGGSPVAASGREEELCAS
jgi:glycosyltransferase involved in cell wall biosynthesis